MTPEPITVELNPAMWKQRQEWIEKREVRSRASRDAARRHVEAMSSENSMLVPGSGTWVCHGAVEYAAFTEEEAEDNWPDKAFWRCCPPQPVVAWRVSRSATDGSGPGSVPNIVLPEGEFDGDFTDSSFGPSPAEAILQARRLLVADREVMKKDSERCSAASHTLAKAQQEDAHATCLCGERSVKFVLAQ